MRKLWIGIVGVFTLTCIGFAQTFQSGVCFSPSASLALIGGAPTLHTGDTIVAQAEAQNTSGAPESLIIRISLTPPGASTPVVTNTRTVFLVTNLEKANTALVYTIPCPTGPTGYWTLSGSIDGCSSGSHLPVTAQVYVGPQPFCP